MGRWSSNDQEAQHISEIISKTAVHGTVVLKDGRGIAGVVLPGATGNNGGQGGHWKYYGELTVGGETFDALDVAEIIGGKPN
jgi:hypothetical protein